MQTLKSIFHKYHELINYAIFGVLTTLVNILVFMILQQTNSNLYLVNNTIAWLLSVIFAFITNKIYVFKSPSWDLKTLSKEITLFFSSRLFTLFVDEAIMYLGISILLQSPILTKIIDQIIIILLNFILSKFSFKTNKTK